jgi:acetyltransferase-like isoleucine patch superfamily enzyme
MSNSYSHPTAVVESSHVGAGTRVWAFAHVMAGARVGDNCNLGDHTFVESGAVIGNNVTLKNNVCVWAGVTLEDDVFVGPNVAFTNDRYPRSPRMPQVRQRYEHPDHWLEPTVVERGATIGANATILPGVRLGPYSMIAAGAVVTGDVPPFALMVGSPARPVADVCRCGQKLAGSYLTAGCAQCGETPAMRSLVTQVEEVAL